MTGLRATPKVAAAFCARLMELVDTRDLKSRGPRGPCWFESSSGHHHTHHDDGSSRRHVPCRLGWGNRTGSSFCIRSVCAHVYQANLGKEKRMKFGIFYELQLPRPW